MKRKFQISVKYESDYDVEVSDEEAEENGWNSAEEMAEAMAVEWFQECYPNITSIEEVN